MCWPHITNLKDVVGSLKTRQKTLKDKNILQFNLEGLGGYTHELKFQPPSFSTSKVENRYNSL